MLLLEGRDAAVNWIQNLSKAIDYIENNLTTDISIDEVSAQAFSSSSHFQLVFHVVMG
jgi:AraC-like DNA-binding protein